MNHLLSYENQYTWRLPFVRTSPYFNARLARRLKGKHVLVGLTYVSKKGKVTRQEQYHGVVVNIDKTKGVEIWKDGTTKIAVLPPDLRAWERAGNGYYRLRSTAEEITNVDYLSAWTLFEGHEQPMPNGGSLQHRNSGIYNIYGCGTTLYGHADTTSKGAYTTTKWITILAIPIWPLGSYRIHSKKGSVGFGIGPSGMHVAEPVFLDLRQVVLTYLISVPTLLAFLYVTARILS